MKRKINNTTYLKYAIEVHGNKYDYTNTLYISYKENVEIFCNICKKTFIQRADHHLNGCGCNICSGNKKLNQDEFFNRVIKKYGNIFDFSETNYLNMHSKILFGCKEHGIVEQPAMNLLKYGCKYCSKKYMDTEKYIKIAKEIHCDIYDYSLVKYIDSKHKILIICKEHNHIFEQLPGNHINKKHGCPLCGNKKRRLKRIEEIRINKFNGNQVIPSFNKTACKVFDDIMNDNKIFIQHAMNGGEYYISELGYWLDGYDKENNIAYEYDEKYHFDKFGNLLKSDLIRQNEIEKHLNCKFIRIKYN